MLFMPLCGHLSSNTGHLRKVILEGRKFRCGSDEKLFRLAFTPLVQPLLTRIEYKQTNKPNIYLLYTDYNVLE